METHIQLFITDYGLDFVSGTVRVCDPGDAYQQGSGGHRDKQDDVAGDVRRRTSLRKIAYRSRKYHNQKSTSCTGYNHGCL